MGNDWKIAISKAIKSAIVGGVIVSAAVVGQIDAQCPGATLTVGGIVIGVKVIADFLINIAKHSQD